MRVVTPCGFHLTSSAHQAPVARKRDAIMREAAPLRVPPHFQCVPGGRSKCRSSGGGGGLSCPPSELRERNEPKGGGFGVETGKIGAKVPVRRVMLREREPEPRCWTIRSQAERRDRGQTEKSWLLFEGIDMFLYDLTRRSPSSATLGYI